MKRIILCLIAISIFMGCGALKIQKDDSIPMKLTKGFTRVPLCLLTCFMSEYYYSVERLMGSWLGHSMNELINAWGPPSQVYDDSSGGKFIVYTYTHVNVSPGYATTNGSSYATGYISGNNIYVNGYNNSTTTYTPPQVNVSTSYRMFQADSYGTIVSYRWEGLT